MAVADTTMTIYGSGHLTGQTVRVVVCGVDAGNALVATDGSVAITFGQDPGAILSPSYLVAHPSEGTDHDVTFSVFDGSAVRSVTVPVLVGIQYTCKGQLIRPIAEAQLGAGTGAGLGKTRRASWGALLVRDLLALQIGTDLTNMDDMLITTDGGITPELAIAADAPYSGVLVSPLTDILGFDSALAWKTNKPVSVVIGGAGAFLDGATR